MSVHKLEPVLLGAGQVKAFYMDNVSAGFSRSNAFLKGSERNSATGGVRAGDYSAITLDENGVIFATSMEAQQLPPNVPGFISNFSNWGQYTSFSKIEIASPPNIFSFVLHNIKSISR